MKFGPGRPKPPVWRIFLYMLLGVVVIFVMGVLRSIFG